MKLFFISLSLFSIAYISNCAAESDNDKNIILNCEGDMTGLGYPKDLDFQNKSQETSQVYILKKDKLIGKGAIGVPDEVLNLCKITTSEYVFSSNCKIDTNQYLSDWAFEDDHMVDPHDFEPSPFFKKYSIYPYSVASVDRVNLLVGSNIYYPIASYNRKNHGFMGVMQISLHCKVEKPKI